MVLVDTYLGDYICGIEGIVDKTFSGKDYIILGCGFVPSENMKVVYMLDREKDRSELNSVLSRMSVSTLNFIYEDGKGDIGYYLNGLNPKGRLMILICFLKWWLAGDLYKLVAEKGALIGEVYDKMIFYPVKE